MDYNKLFLNDSCETEHKIIGLFTILTCFFLGLDCMLSCGNNRRLDTLEAENKTLKNIILKTVDRTLVRMMKNGNSSENFEDY